jgi:prephenate dehydrogenase
MQLKRVAIFGVGLLGGSIGLALRSRGDANLRIVGYGHRKETLQHAQEIGAIDELTQDPATAARGADLIILCTPVGVFDQLIQQIAAELGEHTIVTDVGSTKRSIVAAAAKHFQNRKGHFVGSHPMAGSEKRGVEFARTDLFVGARCIVTPTSQTPAHAQQAVTDFWKSLGMKVTILSPEDHDRLVCEISHLPHAVAAAIVAMQNDDALQLAGNGFLDTTRVAGGDGGLWRDIFQDNRDNVADSIRRLREKLDEFLALLDPQKRDELAKWLDEAARRRAKLVSEKLKEMQG